VHSTELNSVCSQILAINMYVTICKVHMRGSEVSAFIVIELTHQ
jgi:hypothetical protein